MAVAVVVWTRHLLRWRGYGVMALAVVAWTWHLLRWRGYGMMVLAAVAQADENRGHKFC